MTSSIFAKAGLAVLSAMAFALPAQAQPSQEPAVLLISIDGLSPGYVLNADDLGLNIPTLREFLRKGAYATGVTNVTPTVTYPNHTTLVTGVDPNVHGIKTNTVFDPEGAEKGAWNWYGSQIEVPTLWDAAKAEGMTTASVLWPVSVAHPALDYNVPEYWRTKTQPSDNYLMYAVSTPRGFLENVNLLSPLFDSSNSDHVTMDANLTEIALAMIEEGKPQLLTIHIVGLDGVQHANGPLPGDEESMQVLEKLDTMIGRIIAAELAAYPNATIAIASDHGFHRVDATINLNAAFARAGLIELDVDNKLDSWRAYAWNSGGSASVVLKDSNDKATFDAVNEILTKLENDPASGISSVVRGAAAVTEGALPFASFLVDSKGGYAMGGALTGETTKPQNKTTGTHGYRNTHPEMNSSFFILGPGVTAGKNLGHIDIRQIAPTLARELGVSLPTAQQPPLPLHD